MKFKDWVEIKHNGKSKTEVAKILGISRPTLDDWLKDPDMEYHVNTKRITTRKLVRQY